MVTSFLLLGRSAEKGRKADGAGKQVKAKAWLMEHGTHSRHLFDCLAAHVPVESPHTLHHAGCLCAVNPTNSIIGSLPSKQGGDVLPYEEGADNAKAYREHELIK